MKKGTEEIKGYIKYQNSGFEPRYARATLEELYWVQDKKEATLYPSLDRFFSEFPLIIEETQRYSFEPLIEESKEESNKTILQEAQDVVYGDRQADYGSVTSNFTTIAKLWSAVLGINVSPEQVGLCMIQVKVAREMNKPKRDNLVDICGYAACIEKMENENDKLAF